MILSFVSVKKIQHIDHKEGENFKKEDPLFSLMTAQVNVFTLVIKAYDATAINTQ